MVCIQWLHSKQHLSSRISMSFSNYTACCVAFPPIHIFRLHFIAVSKYEAFRLPPKHAPFADRLQCVLLLCGNWKKRRLILAAIIEHRRSKNTGWYYELYAITCSWCAPHLAYFPLSISPQTCFKGHSPFWPKIRASVCPDRANINSHLCFFSVIGWEYINDFNDNV